VGVRVPRQFAELVPLNQKTRNHKAANPNIVPQVELPLTGKSEAFSKARETSLKKRIYNLLQEIFEG